MKILYLFIPQQSEIAGYPAALMIAKGHVMGVPDLFSHKRLNPLRQMG
ncbi:MAG: hypothetical protein M1281_07050 [Chloroflexi bacterium]|nr:hypothetical protein [Chloroflexota bacterium]